MIKSFQQLEHKLGYTFRDYKVLEEALTHSSYANEKNDPAIQHNERLEFLGDSVLGLVISDFLFMKYPDFPEGDLTKIRAKIVCEPTLAEIASTLDLGYFMYFGKGEAMTGGRERQSILADALEALFAAVYLDGGLNAARRIILDLMADTIKDAIHGKIFLDYKTALQELVQAEGSHVIQYDIVAETGPDHMKTFEAAVTIDAVISGQGKGKSKKEAEQNAAKMAIKKRKSK